MNTSNCSPPTELSSRPDLTAVPDVAVRNVPAGALTHRVFLHPDARGSEQLVHASVRRKFGESLQRFAIHGTNVRSKSLVGVNDIWKRVGLSGTKGSHFYLYFTTGHRVAGVESIQAVDKRQAVFVRAIRHHDDHTVLEPGDIADYAELCASDLAIAQGNGEDESECGLLLTDQQRDFVTGAEPIRVGRGRPGSGKSTSLLATLVTRSNERVLYLTFSQRLVEQIRAQFQLLQNADTELVALDFTSFLNRILQRDTRRLLMTKAREAFLSAAKHLHNQSNYAGWRAQLPLAFNEARANIIGRLTFRASDDFVARVQSRGNSPSASDRTLDRKNLRALTSDVLRGSADVVDAAFSDLHAAWDARRMIAEYGQSLPEDLVFDRIMVDEIQDMTPLEWGLIADLSEAIASTRGGRLPYLCVVGDEGQTVRPTSFDFGELKGNFGQRFGNENVSANESLCMNIRSPKAIADVIDRADLFYSEIAKSERPGGNARDYADNTTIAHVFHAVPEKAGIEEFLRGFLSLQDSCVIMLTAANARLRVPDDIREAIMSPDEVKGLEFQNVCVLDVGQFVSDEVKAKATAEELRSARTRQAIDALRVAISRAMNSLVFCDLSPSSKAHSISQEMLGVDSVTSTEEILDCLGGGDVPLDERISEQLRRVGPLMEHDPARALRVLETAKALFRQFDHAEPVEIGQDYVDLAMNLAWRMALGQEPLSEAEQARLVSLLDFPWSTVPVSFGDCLRAALSWNQAQSDVCSSRRLLRVVHTVDEPAAWFMNTLRQRDQHFLQVVEQAAADAEFVGWFLLPHVSDALRDLNVTNVSYRVQGLRKKAWRTAADAGDFDLAKQLMELAGDDLAANKAYLFEVLGDHASARVQYEVAGDVPSQVRCLRMLGQSGEALRLLREGSADDPAVAELENFRRISETLRTHAFVSSLMPPERQALVRAAMALEGDGEAAKVASGQSAAAMKGSAVASGSTIAGLLALQTELEREREQAKSDHAEATRANSARADELQRQAAHVAVEQKRLASLSEMLRGREKRLTSRERQLQERDQAVSAREDEYLQLQEELSHATKALDELRSRNAEAASSLQTATTELQSLMAEQRKVESELLRQQEQLATARAEVAAARAELNDVMNPAAHSLTAWVRDGGAESSPRTTPTGERLSPAPTLRKVVDAIEQLSPLLDSDRHRIQSAAGQDRVLPIDPRVRAALPCLVAAHSHVARTNGSQQVSLSALGPHLNARRLGFSKVSKLVVSCPELFHFDHEHGIVTARF